MLGNPGSIDYRPPPGFGAARSGTCARKESALGKQEVMRRMGEDKLIAVVRLGEDPETILRACRALVEGGVKIIEVTADNPRAPEVVRSLRAESGESQLIGAGTVLDASAAAELIAAGAEFIVSPTFIAEVLERCAASGVVCVPGALTPTEVWKAHRRGADAVKVFPASLVGPSYLRSISAPLPGIRLIPTGGVDEDNLQDFLRAGAFAVGMGGALLDTEAVARGDWESITSRARSLVEKARGA